MLMLKTFVLMASLAASGAAADTSPRVFALAQDKVFPQIVAGGDGKP